MNKISLGWRTAALVLWILAFSWCGTNAEEAAGQLAEANFWDTVEVYDAEGSRLGKTHKLESSSLPNNTAAAKVFVSDFEGVSKTCATRDGTSFVSATVLDTEVFRFGETAFFHCLYLKSSLVEVIEEAENEVRRQCYGESSAVGRAVNRCDYWNFQIQ